MKLKVVENRSDALIRELTAVWEASVRATHHFLREEEIVRLRDFVPSALATVPHLVIATDAVGKAVAFMGVDGQKIEMLFVAPAERGHGLGRRLVEYGLSAFGVTAVDVNEQNPAARGFYEHLGFRVCGRSERDGQGAPHPILHMRVDRTHAEPNDDHAEPQSTQSCLGLGKPVPEATVPLPSTSAASAPLREPTVRTNSTDETRAEPQSTQSCLGMGKPVPEATAPLPSTSAASAPLREPTARTNGADENRAEPQSTQSCLGMGKPVPEATAPLPSPSAASA